MNRRNGPFACLFALTLTLALGCDANPEGPTSPSASAGGAASGTESETAAPKEARVKVDGGPASEQ